MIFESGRFKGIFNIDASKNRVNLSKKKKTEISIYYR